MNLAINACQAMPQGGLLELQTGQSGEMVQLSLIDTGCGMNAATLARIFDVFYSTKRNGSGLGLPTVKKIIERHGGRLHVDSEPGRGTRVTLLLPAVRVR